MKVSITLLAFIALTSVACVPYKSTFYQPSASSGSAINNLCGSYVAPKDTMQFEPHGTTVNVSGNESTLQISVKLAGGQSFQFDSNLVNINGRSTPIESFQRYDRESEQAVAVDSSAILVGGNEQYLFGKQPRLFTAWVKFKDSVSETYSVQIPSATINGETYVFPVITFTERSGLGIAPINC